MLHTRGRSQNNFKGCVPSVSPNALPDGVFSLCSGGLPTQGAFMRLPGKTLLNNGRIMGGVLSIYQLKDLVVIQAYRGIIIYDLATLLPEEEEYIVDNDGDLVLTNLGNTIVV